MIFAAAKLVDISARSLFLIAVLFSVGERQAGQFGLAVTLVTWFTFLAGYERYVDLQRTILGRSATEVHAALHAALRLFAINHLILLPTLVVLLVVWVQLPFSTAILYVIITLAEHLSQELYRLGLVVERFRVALIPVLARNLSLCICLALLLFYLRTPPTIEQVSWIWGIVSAIGLFWAVKVFRSVQRSSETSVGDPLPSAIGDQYSRSLTHFKLGVLALGSLQLDRLVVGAVLPLEQSGIYFRHVMLASFFYSALAVVSYNRILPNVYAAVRSGASTEARLIVKLERRRLLAAGLIGLSALIGLEIFLKRTFSDVAVSFPLLAALLIAFLIRTSADYNALLMNAANRERDVLLGFLVAAVPTLLLNLTLSALLGVEGAVAAFVSSAALYLIATQYLLNRARYQ